MLQEDSNGETGFEFVEKRTEDLSLSVGTAGKGIFGLGCCVFDVDGF